jgi:hypothetical protein
MAHSPGAWVDEWKQFPGRAAGVNAGRSSGPGLWRLGAVSAPGESGRAEPSSDILTVAEDGKSVTYLAANGGRAPGGSKACGCDG